MVILDEEVGVNAILERDVGPGLNVSPQEG